MAEKQEIDRGTWLALIAMAIAVFVVANDFSAINVVIPSIEEDFDINVDSAQWVVNAYALTFGVLIVTGGRLADLFGRKRIFFVGAGDLRLDVAGGRGGAQRAVADRRPGADGDRRRPDVAGDPGHDLRRSARREGRARRRA